MPSLKFIFACAVVASVALSQINAESTVATQDNLQISPKEIAKLAKKCFTYSWESHCLAFKGICRWVASKFNHGKCIAHFKSTVGNGVAITEDYSAQLDLNNDQIDAIADYEYNQFLAFEASQEVDDNVSALFAAGSDDSSHKKHRKGRNSQRQAHRRLRPKKHHQRRHQEEDSSY